MDHTDNSAKTNTVRKKERDAQNSRASLNAVIEKQLEDRLQVSEPKIFEYKPGED